MSRTQRARRDTGGDESDALCDTRLVSAADLLPTYRPRLRCAPACATYGAQGVSGGPVVCLDCGEVVGSWSRPWDGRTPRRVGSTAREHRCLEVVA